MEKQKLSVIIPTMGRPLLPWVIDRTLASVDLYDIDCEIIVIFNGGNTGEGFFEEEKYSRVKKLFIKEFSASAARNAGLDAVTGDIVAFLGDDTAPERNWADRVMRFHANNPQKESVLLGMVDWVPELKKTKFHDFLLGFGQFDFVDLKKGKQPIWKHFYTSNVSGKRSFFDTERFSDQFLGWGFEDSEYGYRLSKRGMKIFFQPLCRVEHNHPQTIEGVVRNIKSAKKNAFKFQEMHPEVVLRPNRIRWWFLFVLLLTLMPLTLFSRSLYWWWRIKWAWL